MIALVKASSIILAAECEDVMFSARNNPSGTVAQLHKGDVMAEVIVSISNGGTISATITNESAKSLGLSHGSSVSAMFKASSVILGTPV